MPSAHCSPQSPNGPSLRLHVGKQRMFECMVTPGVCVVKIQHMLSLLSALHEGLPVEIHLKEGANPKAVHTPAVILVHWQERMRHDLNKINAL